jgi:hypothetical protein
VIVAQSTWTGDEGRKKGGPGEQEEMEGRKKDGGEKICVASALAWEA